MEADSSSATFFLIHLKAQLVLSLVVVFTEHSHYTKHDTKALLFLNVKFCLKVKTVVYLFYRR